MQTDRLKQFKYQTWTFLVQNSSSLLEKYNCWFRKISENQDKIIQKHVIINTNVQVFVI